MQILPHLHPPHFLDDSSTSGDCHPLNNYEWNGELVEMKGNWSWSRNEFLIRSEGCVKVGSADSRY